MRKIALAIAAVTLSVSVVSHAIVIRHDVPDEQYHAQYSDFPPLATLYQIGAHGTLIDPQWVVTAAHTVFCIEPGDKIKISDTFAEVGARYAHNSYKRGGEYDIALLKLNAPITSILPAIPYAGDDEAGQQIWFIGAGGTGNGNIGQTVSYKQNNGLLRKAQNTVREVEKTEIEFTFSEGSDALPLEGVSGNGDSGGPAFMQRNGLYYLVGISSRADSWFKEMGEYGVNEVYTRVSAHKDWLANVMLESPSFLAEHTTQERFPQPGIEDRLDEICAQIGY